MESGRLTGDQASLSLSGRSCSNTEQHEADNSYDSPCPAHRALYQCFLVSCETTKGSLRCEPAASEHRHLQPISDVHRTCHSVTIQLDPEVF